MLSFVYCRSMTCVYGGTVVELGALIVVLAAVLLIQFEQHSPVVTILYYVFCAAIAQRVCVYVGLQNALVISKW